MVNKKPYKNILHTEIITILIYSFSMNILLKISCTDFMWHPVSELSNSQDQWWLENID